MKQKIDKISIFSMLFILFLISIPGFYAYYFTDWRSTNFFQDTAQRAAIPEFQEDSKIFDNRIVLRKDKSITVNKSRLVFKGLKDEMIRLDVSLLEFDPESVYHRNISMADAENGIRVGDSKFQLLKVSRKTLQLKIVDVFKS